MEAGVFRCTLVTCRSRRLKSEFSSLEISRRDAPLSRRELIEQDFSFVHLERLSALREMINRLLV